MDGIALQTLRGEAVDDVRVAREACAKAAARLARGDEVGEEAAAHQLARMFNAFEQMALRIAKAFENNIDDGQGWHTGLLKRLSVPIEGVRPALIPQELKLALHELRAFRHLVVHAYDLQFDPQKLALVLKYAQQVADDLPRATEQFFEAIAAQGDGGSER